MGVHLPELIVIFVVALLVFGPKRLPEMGAQIGKSLNAFKKGMSELTDTSNSSGVEAQEISRLEARRLELEILEREIALKKSQAELGESNSFVSSSYDSETTVDADYTSPMATYEEESYPTLTTSAEADYVSPAATYEESYATPETTAETYNIAPTKLEEPVVAPVEKLEAVTVPASHDAHISSEASKQAE